jgi:hypothetical protein
VQDHVSYHSLQLMHCIYVSGSYVHNYDKPRGTAEAVTTRRARQAHTSHAPGPRGLPMAGRPGWLAGPCLPR